MKHIARQFEIEWDKPEPFALEAVVVVDSKPKSEHRVVRMHVVDCGPNPSCDPEHIAKYKCVRCGLESEWQTAESITEIKRGIPCPNCNKPQEQPELIDERLT